MKHLPIKLLVLVLLTVFSVSALSPAYAEAEFKWYNPVTWGSDNGQASKEKAEAKKKSSEKETRERWNKTAKKENKRAKEARKESEKLAKKRQKAEKKAEKKSSKNKKTAKKKTQNKNDSEMGALIETQKGNITIRLYPKQAPKTVSNFTNLVEGRFYDKPGMKFHRVVPGFVIQTGDPTGTGYGGSGHKIPLEVKNKLSHDGQGVVAMARGPLPNSATSQFYITHKKNTQLDGKYAIFGQVIQGFDVIDKIKKDDRLYGIKLIDISDITAEEQANHKGTFRKIFGNFK